MKNYRKKDCRKSICWTNKTRKAINQKWNLKESQDTKYITLNNMRVYKSLPIISKKTFTSEENKVCNNEEFEVMGFDTKTITIKSDITNDTIKIKHEELKHFQLAYCITGHCAQGSTFNHEYSIYEWQNFSKEMLYVAVSRATKRSLINFCNIDYKLNTGYIYKISNKLTNKVYIGSTKTSIEQRYDEHVKCQDTSPLHLSMQELGVENFTIELVETVQYVDEENLYIHEAMHMMDFDSINSGYNQKYPIDLTNIF